MQAESQRITCHSCISRAVNDPYPFFRGRSLRFWIGMLPVEGPEETINRYEYISFRYSTCYTFSAPDSDQGRHVEAGASGYDKKGV